MWNENLKYNEMKIKNTIKMKIKNLYPPIKATTLQSMMNFW